MRKTFAAVTLAVSLSSGILLYAADDPGITKVRSAYAAAVDAGDAAKIAALFTENGVEMPPNQALVKGRAAIQSFNAGMFDTMSAKITITPMDTRVSGALAVDVGTYSQTLKTKAGQSMDDKGKYVVVLEKDKSAAWHIAYIAYNSDSMPPAVAAGAAPAKP